MQIKLHDNKLVQAFQVIFEYIRIVLYQPRQHIQKQRHYFANKVSSSQGYGFSSSHVRIWELDYKENWALKILLNCGIGADSRVPRTEGDQTSQSYKK